MNTQKAQTPIIGSIKITINRKIFYKFITNHRTAAAEDWISIDLASLATLDFLGYSEPFTYEWSDGERVIQETYTADDFVDWETFVEYDAKPSEFHAVNRSR